MPGQTRLYTALLLGACLLWESSTATVSQEIMRAKTGLRIRSAGQAVWAQARQRVAIGAQVRFYVIAEVPSYVYFVYDDQQTAILLNVEQQKKRIDRGTLLTSPVGNSFYQIDGASQHESFTVICSYHELAEVSSLFRSASVPHRTWLKLQRELIAMSHLDISERIDKPFPITGSVRGFAASESGATLLEGLDLFSGKSFLVQTYELIVVE